MNEELRTFIKTYLDLEQGYDVSGWLRPTLHAFNSDYVEAVRVGLATVLENRELSVEAYDDLSCIEFENEEILYEYLQNMYDYLFGDLPEQPLPPL
ncbi:hypothetical protein ACR820_02880 [Streptomyces netropsis]